MEFDMSHTHKVLSLLEMGEREGMYKISLGLKPATFLPVGHFPITLVKFNADIKQ
jgi:hypothetical protein